jgi:gamma-glutamyltranspeptidase/glutathione hydrolase
LATKIPTFGQLMNPLLRALQALGAPLLSTFLACTLLLPAAAAQTSASGLDYKSEQPVRAPHAMVVTVHHDATDAGVEILKKGGNAVDAAVAVGFALAVVHPVAGNLGGGGFMLVRFKNGDAHFLDYREEAPGAATMNMYLDASGNVVPGASTVGYRSIGVPGSVAGMVRAEKLWGKLTLKQAMQPAIRLARDGFVLTDDEADEMHDPLLTKFPASRHIFQRDGNFYRAGDTFRQPELAHTLLRIAANPETFYRGSMARQIAAAIQKGGGLITVRDLAHYHVKDRAPLVGEYHGYQILTAPPPSGGGIGLLETLNILAPYDLTSLGDRSPRDMHFIVEAFRRAYMDRTDYLGDPDFTPIPVKQMIGLPYAAAFRASILPDKATPSSTLQRPPGFLPPPPKLAPPHHESNQTTHYSIVDAEGNAVAVTTTLNNSYGSGVTVPALGFLLNDEMDDFASKQGVPNMYGLIQGPANAIGPGKRPLSAMTPTIAVKNGKVAMVLGSPGGPRITTTVANIFLSVADGGLNIQQAVDAPRFHHQYLPDILYLEPGFPASTVTALNAMQYTVDVSQHHWSNGECIAIDPTTGELSGGQDHRSHYGKAAGY